MDSRFHGNDKEVVMRILLAIVLFAGPFMAFSDRTPNELGTALLNLSQLGTVEEVQEVLAEGADINFRGDIGTALHGAVRFNIDPNVAQFLLSEGANVNAQNSKGDTPLHLSVFSHNSFKMTQLLLDAGASVNVLNKDGESPLHKALMFEVDVSIITMLVEAGADLDILDVYGASPWDYIRWNYPEEVETMLMELVSHSSYRITNEEKGIVVNAENYDSAQLCIDDIFDNLPLKIAEQDNFCLECYIALQCSKDESWRIIKNLSQQ